MFSWVPPQVWSFVGYAVGGRLGPIYRGETWNMWKRKGSLKRSRDRNQPWWVFKELGFDLNERGGEGRKGWRVAWPRSEGKGKISQNPGKPPWEEKYFEMDALSQQRLFVVRLFPLAAKHPIRHTERERVADQERRGRMQSLKAGTNINR